LGLGFRLGNNADFQFLVELGPQISTQPVGPQKAEATSNTLKRHAVPAVELTNGSDWLSKWRANVERRNAAQAISASTSSATSQPQNANQIINEPMILHLRKLYRGDGDPDANNATDSNTVGSPERALTSKVVKGLDDVAIDDK